MTAQQTKGTVLLVCLWHIQTKSTVPLVCKGEAGVKFSAKQKRALETAEQSQKTAIATAVSSADGAKILNSIDKLVESLEKSAKSFGKFDTTSFQEIILSSGVFRRETASGFYPWGNVDSPRKRVAEGLCGWRHGNSFPMTQSAQSHRQMRSIPRCPKAVFYVFFDSINDSATMHNLSPLIFH